MADVVTVIRVSRNLSLENKVIQYFSPYRVQQTPRDICRGKHPAVADEFTACAVVLGSIRSLAFLAVVAAVLCIALRFSLPLQDFAETAGDGAFAELVERSAVAAGFFAGGGFD